MLEGIAWVYPLLLTGVVILAVFLSTRSSDWYGRLGYDTANQRAPRLRIPPFPPFLSLFFRRLYSPSYSSPPLTSFRWYLKLFTLVFYREMAFGKLLPIFPPDSKPPSRESLAMYGIFSKFPKTNIPKPVLERRAAFDRTGVLQTKSATTKIEKPFTVPFLPSSPASLATPGVVVYPIRPAVSLHGKVIVYLHAGTYISGSIRSHGKFVSHIAEQAHRLLYFVEYSYALPSSRQPSLFSRSAPIQALFPPIGILHTFSLSPPSSSLQPRHLLHHTDIELGLSVSIMISTSVSSTKRRNLQHKRESPSFC